jgi:hypothetical protein
MQSGARPVEFLTFSQASAILGAATKPISIFSPPIADVTLSGAVMSAPGVYLELNEIAHVDGNSGEISFWGGGEVYLRLLGLEVGATYLGQMRCTAGDPFSDEPFGDDSAIAVNVFGGAQGTQFGQIRVTQRSLAVPFIFVSARGPIAVLEGQKAPDNTPMVAFNPVKLGAWFVHDIRIQRVA